MIGMHGVALRCAMLLMWRLDAIACMCTAPDVMQYVVCGVCTCCIFELHALTLYWWQSSNVLLEPTACQALSVCSRLAVKCKHCDLILGLK